MTITDTFAGPRHPLATPSSLDERLRRSLEKQHFSVSTENGPPAYFMLLIHAARTGDAVLARDIHERLRRLGWVCYETGLPERGGHP
jgi:hypothetical protein